MSIPLFVCLLFPRRDANPTELKMLGEAIGRWSRKEEKAGLQVFFDPRPVQDLLLGELPQPMALRMTLKAHELTEESSQLLEGRGGWANLTPEEV